DQQPESERTESEQEPESEPAEVGQQPEAERAEVGATPGGTDAEAGVADKSPVLPQEQQAAQEPEEVELTLREKPEIPGADLVPDIVPEGEEFLDAEAQAEAEAVAATHEEEPEDQAQPIADAAI